MEDDKQPLIPKARGKGLMVSDILTPGGNLAVPGTITDVELNWLHNFTYASEDWSLAKTSIGGEMT